MNKPKDYFISFNDIVSALGMLESDFLEWVKEDKPEIGTDHLNRKATRKSYLEKCALKSDYLSKLERSFKSENSETERETDEKIQLYLKERSILLDMYASFMKDLIRLHKKYKKDAESHGIESPVIAAYLLFSKAISILSCLCENLRQGYWYVGSMLREIDETLDVALYFILNSEKDPGKADLKRWFRLGFSPSHYKCRATIAEWQSQLDSSYSKKNHKLLMSNLYGLKSKFTHPTFQSIRDCTIMSYSNSDFEIKKMCYGQSYRQKRLWELTHFTKSSIWTCFQQFLLIFIDSMPLKQEDIDYLLECDKKFIALSDNWKW